jgi:hypothetical protein
LCANGVVNNYNSDQHGFVKEFSFHKEPEDVYWVVLSEVVFFKADLIEIENYVEGQWSLMIGTNSDPIVLPGNFGLLWIKSGADGSVNYLLSDVSLSELRVLESNLNRISKASKSSVELISSVLDLLQRLERRRPINFTTFYRKE